MHHLASAVILTYGAILIAGGIVGWRASGNRILLTSSLASAALLSVAFRIAKTAPGGGYLMAALVALALTGFFALRFRKTRKAIPSGIMLALSVVVTIILAWSTSQTWR